MKRLVVSLAVTTLLIACGGGGEGKNENSASGGVNAGSGGSGAGSVFTSGGSIQYRQYYSGPIAWGYDILPPYNSSLPVVNAEVQYNSSTMQGGIDFPLFGASQKIQTTNGYKDVQWTGKLTAGLMAFDGNVLMGCDLRAPSSADRNHVFVSTALSQITDMKQIDDIYGKTFTAQTCGTAGIQFEKDVVINKDGTSTWSILNGDVLDVNGLITLLQMNTYNNGVMLGATFTSSTRSVGHLYKYNKDGKSKFAIALRRELRMGAQDKRDFVLLEKP